MTRGQAQSHIPSAPTVHVFPDGGTVLSTQPVEEAEKALAVVAADERIDRARADFDAAVMAKVRMFEESAL